MRSLVWARGALVPCSVALAARLGLAWAIPVRPVWDGVIYARAADFLAHGLGYVYTVHDPDDPAVATAFYPIGFPALLAPLRWLGAGRSLDLVAQALLGALAVLLVYVLGRRAGGARVGSIAAWLLALWPGGILLSASWFTENAFSVFVLGAALPIAYAGRARGGRGIALAAAILGLAAYVRPTALPVLFALAIGAVLARRARARMIPVALAIALAVIAPWPVRNALVLDAPALLSTNGGINLLIGTRGDGTYARLEEVACGSLPGEVERDRCYVSSALDVIADDPAAWLGRGLLKLAHTFGYESAPAQAWAEAAERVRSGDRLAVIALGANRAWWLPFLAASLAGAVILAQRRGLARVALIAPIVAVGALHAVTIGGDRYHAAVVPLMAVLAAIAIDHARRARC